MNKIILRGAALAAATCIWSLVTPSLSQADQLTYYVYPSPLGVSWNSPAELAWTVLFNNFFPDARFERVHSIGHINFDLNCEPSQELPQGARVVTGQTNEDDDEMTDHLLSQGYGMSEMLTSYKGRWESRDEIEQDLPARFESGRIAFMRFHIKPSTCARVVSYLREYEARGYDRIYGGLQDRPRYGKGGGCIAFGESVLSVAGLLTPELKEASGRFVQVPMSLIGPPITDHEVSLIELLLSPASSNWSHDSSHSYPLQFSDPDKMYHWIKSAWKHSVTLTGMSYVPVTEGKARGLDIRAQEIQTPDDPFFLPANENNLIEKIP